MDMELELELERRRKLKRKPLSDVTNNIKRKPSSHSLSLSSQDTSSIGSSNLPPNPKIPIPFPRPSSNSVDTDCQHSKTPTVYNTPRRPIPKPKDKGKAVAALTFPPPHRTNAARSALEREQHDTNKRNKQQSDVDLSKTSTVPLSKTSTVPRPLRKKERRLSLPALRLPQDFIEEQRKYFEEVDAFELEEEVVSESELE